MDLKCMQRVFFNFARNKRKVRESCVEVPFFFFFLPTGLAPWVVCMQNVCCGLVCGDP